MEKVGLGAVCALAIRPLSQPCNHYTTTSGQSHSPEQHLKTETTTSSGGKLALDKKNLGISKVRL